MPDREAGVAALARSAEREVGLLTRTAPAVLLVLSLARGIQPPGLAGPGAPVRDSVIREILSRVAEDSIRVTIQALQDFTTRYSYAKGCSLAGDYIHRRFSEAGIETEYHHYVIPALAGDLCVLPGGRGWLVDTLGTVLYSSDRGESWVERLGLDYHHLFGLAFPDSAHGWVTGCAVFGNLGVILHTADAGMSWAVQTSFPQARLNKVFFVNQDLGWAAGSRNDSGFVVRTVDRGRAWSSWNTGVRGELCDLWFTDSTRGWAVGGEPGSGQAFVLHTTDRGTSWVTQLCIEGRLDAVCFTDSCTGWAAGRDSSGRPKVLHTTNAGVDWTERSPDTGFALCDVGFLDAGRGWCAGDSGFVFQTSDAGVSWSCRRLGRGSLTALAVVDTLTVWLAGERDTVLVTSDLGASWNGYSPRNSYTWSNVLGRIRGTTSPDTIWMVSAHHDSYSTDPCRVAPGADDDASGVAAVIEAARVLGGRSFASSIAFVAFSGEEQNFIGSSEYVRHILPTRPSIAGLLNLDMIGYRDQDWAIDIISDSGSEPLADSVVAIAGEYVPGLAVRKVVDPQMRYWDTNAFWDAGYRAVTMMEREFNPGYHTPGDTLGLLTLPYAADVTKSAVAALACLARCVPAGLEESSTPYASRNTLEARPNPFRTRTAISLQLTAYGRTEIGIYDASGRLVRSWGVSRKPSAASFVTWDGRDARGRALANGVYFCRFVAGDFRATEKLVMQR